MAYGRLPLQLDWVYSHDAAAFTLGRARGRRVLLRAWPRAAVPLLLLQQLRHAPQLHRQPVVLVPVLPALLLLQLQASPVLVELIAQRLRLTVRLCLPRRRLDHPLPLRVELPAQLARPPLLEAQLPLQFGVRRRHALVCLAQHVDLKQQRLETRLHLLDLLPPAA